VEYRVLGPLEVRDGARSLALGGRKQRTLLAILLLHANEAVSDDVLSDGLWGEHPPKTARTALQVHVAALRKLLSAKRLERRAPGYLLHVEPEELDLARFQRLCAEARGREPEAAAAALTEALALWRGRPLADFAYDTFAQVEIARLEELRLGAVEQRIEADLALGRHADLTGELQALIAENPHRERLRGQLMLALYRSGRQAEALQAYQDARHALVDELGIQPSTELQRLEKQILTHDEEVEAPAQLRAMRAEGRAAPRPAPALERNNATVLFVDLALTDEAEDDPEQTVAFLDRVHAEAAAEIGAVGGTVEKGLAGALLATFGAEPAREEDHAVRAVSAAVAIRKRLAHEFGDALALRIGVASGDVILGRPGSFVTGTPVATAARLVRLARPGEIVVGERTATATAGVFVTQRPNAANLLVGAPRPRHTPAQIARQRTERRRFALASARKRTLIGTMAATNRQSSGRSILAGLCLDGAADHYVVIGGYSWIANPVRDRIDRDGVSPMSVSVGRAPVGVAYLAESV